jgi:hypothetical protein
MYRTESILNFRAVAARCQLAGEHRRPPAPALLKAAHPAAAPGPSSLRCVRVRGERQRTWAPGGGVARPRSMGRDVGNVRQLACQWPCAHWHLPLKLKGSLLPDRPP